MDEIIKKAGTAQLDIEHDMAYLEFADVPKTEKKLYQAIHTRTKEGEWYL